MKQLTLDAVEIKRLTGHQKPLLDRVDSITETALTGIASVSMSEDFFQGHFPNNPVMPGVLIIETMSEACQVMYKRDNPLLKLSQIKKARFREMVKPGSQLVIKIHKEDDFVFKSEAYLEDKLACSAELIFS